MCDSPAWSRDLRARNPTHVFGFYRELLGFRPRRFLRSAYNVNAKNWIAPSESVETIEQGKLRAATYAEAYLKQTGNLEPAVIEVEGSSLSLEGASSCIHEFVCRL